MRGNTIEEFMKTEHFTYYEDAGGLIHTPMESIHLVVTSPPYPMISMWDAHFFSMDPKIEKAIADGRTNECFNLMHKTLFPIWESLYQVLVPGGIACINIGDAVRTIDNHFQLFANHARILSDLISIGFSPLPLILWRKQTNAPNKFMGSGMLPPGAYVTLEHEYILIVRKGNRREFLSQKEKQRRRESAYFWEERNQWFSDVWFDLKGARQKLENGVMRKRSGAFPFLLPYRLIQMFSVKGDLVLDPFMGCSTTMLAAAASERNSVGYEIQPEFSATAIEAQSYLPDLSNQMIEQRLARHREFILNREKECRHVNRHYDFPVITAQEKEIVFNWMKAFTANQEGGFVAEYTSSREVKPEKGDKVHEKPKPMQKNRVEAFHKRLKKDSNND